MEPSLPPPPPPHHPATNHSDPDPVVSSAKPTKSAQVSESPRADLPIQGQILRQNQPEELQSLGQKRAGEERSWVVPEIATPPSPWPRPESPREIDPGFQAQAQALFPELIKDLHQLHQRKKGDLTQGQRAAQVGESLEARRQHSRSVDEAEILKSRIPAAEKGKWIPGAGGDARVDSIAAYQRPMGQRATTQGKQSTRLQTQRDLMAGDGAEEGWVRVKPQYWWRKPQTHSNPEGKPKQPFQQFSGSSFFKKKMVGKCFNCFSPEHVAGLCRRPARCWSCLRSGHKANECKDHQKNQGKSKQEQQAFIPSPLNSSTTSRRTYSEVVREGKTMAARYPGDPRARPARAYCAISATGAIKRRRDEIVDRAAVCWFEGNSHDVDTTMAGDMLRDRFRLGNGCFRVMKHYPEQFLVIFREPEDRRRAVDAAVVPYRGRNFRFAAWSEQRYASSIEWEFHVKVRVEGVPVHCWSEEVVAMALGKSCAIHYVQERSRERDRTRSFDLWAWCSDPSDIPKEVTLAVMEPDRELPPPGVPMSQVMLQFDEPTDLKGGHIFNLRNHLEIVEDLSFLRGRGRRSGPSNRKRRREFVWSYGLADEVGERQERQERPRGRDAAHNRRRDGDDDDDYHHHRGTRRHRSVSSWVRDSRCRGGMEDCHSSTWRKYTSSSSHRYRNCSLPRQQLVNISTTNQWRPKKTKAGGIRKTVSFSEPLVTAWWPKECDGQKSVGQEPWMESESKRKMQQVVQVTHGNGESDGSEFATHFERPLNKGKMEAIMTLVDQGNTSADINSKTKKKKASSKVAPLMQLGQPSA